MKTGYTIRITLAQLVPYGATQVASVEETLNEEQGLSHYRDLRDSLQAAARAFPPVEKEI
jgi:hypothetical protein